MPDFASSIQAALSERFGERLEIDSKLTGLDELARIAAHRVHALSCARYRAGSGRLLRLCPVGTIESDSTG
jgi:hypothetical protein